MKAQQWRVIVFLSGICLGLSGCMVPQSQLADCQAQNRALAQQSRAQLVELDSLRAHGHELENQLVRTEQEMASLEEQIDLDRKRLANYEHSNGELYDQFKTVANARHLPPNVSRQLADLSRRYPSLNFDPATGIGKLDTDILFDSGQAELKPAAQAMLSELSRILQAPEAGDLKIMVVGHTDNQRLAGKPVRERFSNNFHLSTARALAVADLMRHQGLGEQRIGVAGFGPYQPVAPNVSASDRQKNRRVEIFLMAPDVPVVGWTDSIPSMY
jgi:chemotaxis protein MotB